MTQGESDPGQGQRCGEVSRLETHPWAIFISFQKGLMEGVWVEAWEAELQGPPFSRNRHRGLGGMAQRRDSRRAQAGGEALSFGPELGAGFTNRHRVGRAFQGETG